LIKNLYLKNFKCFNEQYFSFSSLTIFCGPNSSGKSTAIQSLLSIKQNIHTLKNNKYHLNGDLFSFGKIKDILSHNPDSNEIVIGVNDFKVKLFTDQLDSKECDIKKENISEFKYLNTFIENDFVYLCAERNGPRSSFKQGQNKDILDIGIYGQYALYEYFKNQDKYANNQEFAKKICADLIDPNNEKPIFTDALVKHAMRLVCPDFAIRVTEAEEIDRVYSLYLSGSQSIRPINVGFGVSYVLPIIISAALIKPGGILIIENPEVHLHPSAQSSLISILCELSKTGVQVIIETHSDHIINGIRVYAKQNDFNKEDNIIHSVTSHSGIRHVKEIHVDQDGNLTALDDGFFDQITKDLMRLF